MMNNFKLIILIFCVLILGCHKKSKLKDSNRIKLHGQNLTERQVGNIIINLNHSKDSVHAYQLIDTLIALNGNTGFINFEKGIVEFHNSKFKTAINYFELAKSLGYNENKCQIMIKSSQSMMDVTNK